MAIGTPIVQVHGIAPLVITYVNAADAHGESGICVDLPSTVCRDPAT